MIERANPVLAGDSIPEEPRRSPDAPPAPIPEPADLIPEIPNGDGQDGQVPGGCRVEGPELTLQKEQVFCARVFLPIFRGKAFLRPLCLPGCATLCVPCCQEVTATASESFGCTGPAVV